MSPTSLTAATEQVDTNSDGQWWLPTDWRGFPRFFWWIVLIGGVAVALIVASDWSATVNELFPDYSPPSVGDHVTYVGGDRSPRIGGVLLPNIEEYRRGHPVLIWFVGGYVFAIVWLIWHFGKAPFWVGRRLGWNKGVGLLLVYAGIASAFVPFTRTETREERALRHEIEVLESGTRDSIAIKRVLDEYMKLIGKNVPDHALADTISDRQQLVGTWRVELKDRADARQSVKLVWLALAGILTICGVILIK